MKSICVFCGTREGVKKQYRMAAVRCGELLAKNGLTLIYGGSNVGLMAALSNTVMDNGGCVTGIYPSILHLKEPFSAKISNPIFVDNMSIRKDIMISNADAFFILPGGIGTLDELYEIMTLKVLGAHNKPIIIINTEGYWNKFIELSKHMVAEKFAAYNMEESYQVVETPEEALQALGFHIT